MSDLRVDLDAIANETGVDYDPEGEEIQFQAEGNVTEHFRDFVKFLYNEGLIDEIPYVPGWGKIRYLLNDEPVHQDGRDMFRPAEIADGVYLETNHNTEAKKRYLKRMIDDFVRGTT